jgi:N,N'-diacetyllegionaminate synthase
MSIVKNALHARGRPVIGEGLPPYVIAEIGTNHNQDFDLAKQMVQQIAQAGADCAKFQIYEPDEIVNAQVKASEYGLEALYGDVSTQEMFRNHLQTPKEWFPRLVEECHQHNLDCAVTIHGENGLAWVMDQEVDLIKIASMDHTNTPFLQSLVNVVNVPILISFGMAELDDIEKAAQVLAQHTLGFAMFHCVAIYPPEPEELRLHNIVYLQKQFDAHVGFSDHAEDTVTATAALALGAQFFEKHVTTDKTQAGPDHPFALEMDELATYVEQLKHLQPALGGTEFIPPCQREIKNRHAYVKSVTTKRDLSTGHCIDASDVYLVRPGTGIVPGDLSRVIGKTLIRDVSAETPLQWEDVEGGCSE